MIARCIFYIGYIEKLRDRYREVCKMPFTSRYVYYPYILSGLAMLLKEIKEVEKHIQCGEGFDVGALIGIDVHKIFAKSDWSPQDEDQNAREKIDNEECDRWCDFDFFDPLSYKKDILKESMSNPEYFSQKNISQCVEIVDNAISHLLDIKNWAYTMERYIDNLRYEIIYVYDSIQMFVSELTDSQYLNIIDRLVSKEDISYVSARYSTVNGEFTRMLREYEMDKKGCIEGMTKEDLLGREMWKFVGRFLESNFLEHLIVGTPNTLKINKLWNEVKDRPELKNKEVRFKQFNCLFKWENDRFEIDRLKTAKYILRFRKELSWRDVFEWIQFAEVLERILLDVRRIEQDKKCDRGGTDGLAGLIEVLDGDKKIGEKVGKDRVIRFFEMLQRNDGDEYGRILREKLKGSKNAKKIGGVSVGPLVMVLGVLSSLGWLEDMDGTYIEKLLEGEGLGTNNKSWSRYFTGGKNRTKEWTTKGTKSEDKSALVYGYIEAVADSVM